MSIRLILGCMFSGKTSALFTALKRYQFANKKILLIKYGKDQRYDKEKCSTHDLSMMDAISTLQLNIPEIDELIKSQKIDVIGIDEGNFYPDLVEQCEKWANQGLEVIVSALDGTSQRTLFGQVHQLIPKAENIEKLHAVCVFCYKEASFSLRVDQDNKEEQFIGGIESYKPVCRACWNKFNL